MSKFANLYFLGLIYLDIDHQRDDQNLPTKPKQIYEKKNKKTFMLPKVYIAKTLTVHQVCIVISCVIAGGASK